jgi:hypothetical protein
MNYISAALTVVAGLAWNDAVKSTLSKYVDAVGDDILGKYIYAVMVTLITIVAVYLINELNNKVKTILPDKASKLLSLSDASDAVVSTDKTKEHIKGFLTRTPMPSQPSGILDIGDGTKILFVPTKGT